jgi:hypothetical protein
VAKWGRTPHNKGVYKMSQEGLWKGYKRCGKCKKVQLLDDFFAGSGYAGRRATCKHCDNARRVANGFVQDERLSYYTIKYDPTGTFERGVRFPEWDFRESLKGNVWPVGMIVEREPVPGLFVIVTKLATIEEAYANQEDNDGT